ncbi:ABC-type transport auxiliary lipoprotein family protein [Methylophaga sp. SB9B]|uniref:ABC-type transport auxiliary lipoprotein family protein n=1 Tax=Methylophaga sp. SB9B TaxID=2570356 RepID=UPI001B3C14D4
MATARQSGKTNRYCPFNIETTLASDGYPALVRALGSNLDKLAEQLASQIQQR